MPNIYESNNKYYIQENDKFILCNVMIKRNAIVLMKSDIVENEIENYKIYTYKELKNKLTKREE